MGAHLQAIDEIARQKAEEIPCEVRVFLSHHLRNSLMGLLCIAHVDNSDPKIKERIVSIVGHIDNDLGSLGL
jgi:hypothetical protein